MTTPAGEGREYTREQYNTLWDKYLAAQAEARRLREALASMEFDTSAPSDEMDCPMCEENERLVVKALTPPPTGTK